MKIDVFDHETNEMFNQKIKIINNISLRFSITNSKKQK